MMGDMTSKAPESPERFVRVGHAHERTSACTECGGSVQEEMFQTHSDWHERRRTEAFAPDSQELKVISEDSCEIDGVSIWKHDGGVWVAVDDANPRWIGPRAIAAILASGYIHDGDSSA